MIGLQVLCTTVSYARPGELTENVCENLIAPLRDISSNWPIILHLSERMKPSKTRTLDDTITMLNQIYPPSAKLWNIFPSTPTWSLCAGSGE